MDYPSTTQALFALIVMIIVLIFILVYCCWGTFSCHKMENMMGDEGVGVDGVQLDRSSSANAALVILPYHNMIYIGDGQTQQVYQIPLRDDKPPSYGDIFRNPPSYNSRSTLEGSEQPPTYEECLQNINGFRMNTSHTNLESETDLSNSSAASVPKPLLISAMALKRKASSSALRASSLLTIRSSTTSNVDGSQSRSQRNIAISVVPTDSSYSNPNLLSCDFDPSFNSVTTSNPCISTTNNFPKDPPSASQ